MLPVDAGSGLRLLVAFSSGAAIVSLPRDRSPVFGRQSPEASDDRRLKTAFKG
jgi:hypothetical protein